MFKKIRVRFAPSPTGFMHLGNIRTALFNYLFAQQKKATFVLRIEDTDESRNVDEAVFKIIQDLKWLGLRYKEGPIVGGKYAPYNQSERKHIYQQHLDDLILSQKVYRCFCSQEELEKKRQDQIAKKLPPRYDGTCLHLSEDHIKQKIAFGKKFIWRFKIDTQKIVELNTLERGILKFDLKNFSDFALTRQDESFTFLFANFIDDWLMKISHVIRGEEWLPSTPKHIYLYRAFGWEEPQFAHIPLLLNKDKSKLSKRQNDVAVEDYIAKGYLKEALINFIALLGWNPGDGSTQEIFSMKELIETFSLKKVHKAGAVFDLERLDFFNAHYIREFSAKEFADKIYPWLEKEEWFKGTAEDLHNEYAYKFLPAVQTRIKTLAEAPAMIRYFLTDKMDYDLSLLEHEKMKITPEIAKQALQACAEDLQNLDNYDEEDAIKEHLIKTIERLGMKNGQVLWPLRVALSGEQYSPGAFEIVMLLGKEKTLDRIAQTLQKL